MSKSVCVMQPYFFPYAGYYELFRKVDLFIVFDNSQMKKNGWIHRNVFKNENDNLMEWLTLPLQKFQQKDLINQIKLSDTFQISLEERFQKFHYLRSLLRSKSSLEDVIFNPDTEFLSDYLTKQLIFVSKYLNPELKFINASRILKRSSEESYQEYIINLCLETNATRYVNLSGGKNLYNATNFRENGLNLEILPEFLQSNQSFLYNLLEL